MLKFGICRMSSAKNARRFYLIAAFCSLQQRSKMPHISAPVRKSRASASESLLLQLANAETGNVA